MISTLEERRALQFFIDGQWVAPSTTETVDLIDPSSERPTAAIALGGPADVDAAVAAAVRSVDTYARTTIDERIALLASVAKLYAERLDHIGDLIQLEMGAPRSLARGSQARAGLGHLVTARKSLESFEFEQLSGAATIRREPVGVCALITPWNWPMNQLVCKLAPALAAGCTMVVKPSENAPLSAIALMDILGDAGVPPGVVNLVNGNGVTVGRALSGHPSIDMVSFTGSTRGGVDVAMTAAPSVKRVAQELGGKSANIILDDADLAEVVDRDVRRAFENSGQSCAAPTRMLVPSTSMDRAAEFARRAAEALQVGDPGAADTDLGPLASAKQYDHVQRLIRAGIDEGARLVTGGLGRPEHLDRGYYAHPTVFSHVDNKMTVAQEEIFGPVLVIIGYEDDDDAVRIANDSPYGLAGYVSGSTKRSRRIATRIRAGSVYINGAAPDLRAPFGGFKRSGNGREWGVAGLEEFLETKSITG